MQYAITKYDAYDDCYRFVFNDKRWINIDLVNDYPNYHIINNNYSDPNWFYISDDEKKTLKLLNVLELRKISTKHNKVRSHTIVYSIATQPDYDKYSNNKVLLELKKERSSINSFTIDDKLIVLDQYLIGKSNLKDKCLLTYLHN